MTRIIVDGPIRARLEEAAGVAEIRDANGRILGYFRRVPDLSEYEGTECPVSEEELQRRIQEGGGRTLKEILADLEKLA